MYFYLIKAVGKDEYDTNLDDDVMLMYNKKLTQKQFDLLFDKIYIECDNWDTSNKNIANEMVKHLDFKIVNIIGPAYMVEIEKCGHTVIVYQDQKTEIDYNIFSMSDDLIITTDRNRGKKNLMEDENLSEEKYEKAYVASLKKIVRE